MANILCALSGIEFKVEHFPVELRSRECWHPVFDLKQSRLHKYYQKHCNAELTKCESYLLFLALLRSSELVDWRVAVKQTTETASIVSNYMESLYSIVSRISEIKHPAFSIPNIAITPDTADLANVKSWITTWNEAYIDFLSGLRNSDLRLRLSRREAGLEKLIKSPQISPEKYASVLAAWASEAGQFPEFAITNPLSEAEPDGSYPEISISEYWQAIIIRCYKTEAILGIPTKDLQELIDHCETNIDAGSIFSHQLFAALEEGKSRQSNFFGIGDMIALSAENPGFRILNSEDSVESANISVLIDSAPQVKPVRTDYPSDFSYLKAKSKYELSLMYRTKPDSEENSL